MTDEKNIPDRMGKKYHTGTHTWICAIGGSMIGSMIDVHGNDENLRQLFLTWGMGMIGYSIGQAIDYARGYFNERLELENKRLKQNELENISEDKSPTEKQ